MICHRSRTRRRAARSAGSRSPRTACGSWSRTPSCSAAGPSGSRFRIVDERGETVRDFDVEHTKRMHLILARRDLTGFQHLHPEQQADGTWTTTVRLDEAGSYRLFADFSHEDEAQTLASDLRVDGAADLQPLPAAGAHGGERRRLRRAPRRGPRSRPAPRPTCASRSRRTARRCAPSPTSAPVGISSHCARGTWRSCTCTRWTTRSRFAATFPTEGRYRLFLQFQHEGRVQTVAFTQEVS